MSKAPTQRDETFQEMLDFIWQYMHDRDWQDNPARALAISIALEANELLEHYQWKEQPVGSKEDLASEVADILIYTFQFAAQQGIDIPTAMRAKLETASKKYPAESFKNKSKEERSKAWLNAKLNHKKEGL